MTENKIVRQTIEFIESRLNEDLTLEKIANHMNYSKFHLSRMFYEDTNITIYQYIKNRRLTESAHQLITTDKPIISIAYDAHYNSQQAYTQAFHRLYRITPLSFRQNGSFYPKQIKLVKETRRNNNRGIIMRRCMAA